MFVTSGLPAHRHTEAGTFFIHVCRHKGSVELVNTTLRAFPSELEMAALQVPRHPGLLLPSSIRLHTQIPSGLQPGDFLPALFVWVLLSLPSMTLLLPGSPLFGLSLLELNPCGGVPPDQTNPK